MAYERIAVKPVTARIGAEIEGVDLTKAIDDGTLAEIRQALLDYGVIFFRDQHSLTPEAHKAFGELHIHPAIPGPEGHPEILPIHADENSTYIAGERWHSDVSCDAEPPLGSYMPK